MKKVNIGILGLGIVGGALANIIIQNKEKVIDKYGIEINIQKVYVRDQKKKRQIDFDDGVLTSNPDDIVNDKNIDVICECMGGNATDQTKEILLKAMKNNKHIVMASKKVLAKHTIEVLDMLKETSVQLRYDATVGGGIPVAKIIKDCFKGEHIKKIVGILNATSNFIYTCMEQKNFSYENALVLAQEAGYAENDPTEDVGGFDALYKLVVLGIFSMKKSINIQKMKPNPFSDISLIDMKYAKELGYRIKPLAVIEDRDGELTYRVGPCLIQKNHAVANTVDNYNIIVFEGSNSGLLGFYGQGAGAKPTASAMFDDLISVVTVSKEYGEIITKEQLSDMSSVKEYNDYSNNLYWRFTVENKVGVLAKICTIFMNNDTNIVKLIQKDDIDGEIDVVLLTTCADTVTINNITVQLAAQNMEINARIPFFND